MVKSIQSRIFRIVLLIISATIGSYLTYILLCSSSDSAAITILLFNVTITGCLIGKNIEQRIRFITLCFLLHAVFLTVIAGIDFTNGMEKFRRADQPPQTNSCTNEEISFYTAWI